MVSDPLSDPPARTSERRGHRTPAPEDETRDCEKKSLLLLRGLLLGSWLLRSLLLSGHDGLPPSRYFGPDECVGRAGPPCIPLKTSADSDWVASVMATLSSIAFQSM